MVSLPQFRSPEDDGAGRCGATCGNGLEKVYPSTAVRYGAMNWIGEFNYRPGSVFSCGAKVVAQTDRGIEIGNQVSVSCTGCSRSVSREQIKRYVENSGPEFYRLRAGRILREATPQDLAENTRLNAGIREDIDRCALLAAQHQLDLKVVTAEHLFGGERIVFYFRSEGRIDFRDLVRDLARHYQTRIEMRQVGARDEARLVADYEICGRECCCKNFLKKLRPVTMKMAKVQKSTLDPAKVSGRCGRLRCCLRYEHEGYESLARKLPRMGSWVRTTGGTARVVDRQILTQLVLVQLEDGREMTIPVEEIAEFDLPPPPGGERVAPPPRERFSRPRPPRGRAEEAGEGAGSAEDWDAERDPPAGDSDAGAADAGADSPSRTPDDGPPDGANDERRSPRGGRRRGRGRRGPRPGPDTGSSGAPPND